MTASNGVLKTRVAVRVGEWDRLVLGVLAITRILTTDQLHRLLRGGKDDHYTRRRLGVLGGLRKNSVPGPPLLERVAFHRVDRSLVDAWGLTQAGVLAAAASVIEEARLFGSDFGAEFLDHTTSLNEVFVRLAAPLLAAGVGLDALPFRWAPTDSVRLPWSQYDLEASRSVKRLLIPDGLLEIPSARRRVFLEAESGAHAISSARHDKPGATLAKLDRYEEFFAGFADGSQRVTFYREAFADDLLPEVVFLVRNQARRTNVNAAIAAWRTGRAGVQTRARACLIDDIAKEYGPLLPAVSAAAPTGKAAVAAVPAVPYSAEQVRVLRHFMRAALTEVDAANRAANRKSSADFTGLARDAAEVLKHLQSKLS